MTNLIPVTNDLFDIANRLKSVNPDYVLYYNVQNGRYEVYVGDKLAFTVPFDELDARTVYYARKTSVANADGLFAEIDRYNERVSCEAVNRAKSSALRLAEEGV